MILRCYWHDACCRIKVRDHIEWHILMKHSWKLCNCNICQAAWKIKVKLCRPVMTCWNYFPAVLSISVYVCLQALLCTFPLCRNQECEYTLVDQEIQFLPKCQCFFSVNNNLLFGDLPFPLLMAAMLPLVEDVLPRSLLSGRVCLWESEVSA